MAKVGRIGVCGVLGLCLSLSADVWAEEGVWDVGFEVQGQKVQVTYDLEGKGAYAVSLRLLGDAGKRVVAVPRTVSGDVGQGVTPGKRKKIVWEALKDVKSLEGNDFVFEVRAARSGGSNKWVWIGGAGVTAGVGTAICLGGGCGKKKGTIIIDVPDPEE